MKLTKSPIKKLKKSLTLKKSKSPAKKPKKPKSPAKKLKSPLKKLKKSPSKNLKKNNKDITIKKYSDDWEPPKRRKSSHSINRCKKDCNARCRSLKKGNIFNCIYPCIKHCDKPMVYGLY